MSYPAHHYKEKPVMENIIDELMWRGLIQQSTDIDEMRAAINDGPITLYCGFDPTGDRKSVV